jgi:hypothetical protein
MKRRDISDEIIAPLKMTKPDLLTISNICAKEILPVCESAVEVFFHPEVKM